MESAFLSKKDLCALLNCGRRVVERSAACESIPGRVRSEGRQRRPFRFARKAVLAWIDRGAPGLYAR